MYCRGVTYRCYEAVSLPNGTPWLNAAAAASTRFFQSSSGYLASVMSEEENTFMLSTPEALTAAGTLIWLGGSDSVTEGTYKWVGGPETGLTFWQNTNPASPATGVCLLYCNWASGEPNNLNDEDYVRILANLKWNDLANANSAGVVNMFVKYIVPPCTCSAPGGYCRGRSVAIVRVGMAA